jgi:hypothetical protein
MAYFKLRNKRQEEADELKEKTEAAKDRAMRG